MAEPIKRGEYCLATKWGDGHAADPWAVGFYEGEIFPGRYSVVDGNGKPFRANGFRRCEAITAEQGDFLLSLPSDFELTHGDTSIWDVLKEEVSRG